MITSRAGRMVDQGTEARSFGRVTEIVPLPNLVEMAAQGDQEEKRMATSQPRRLVLEYFSYACLKK